jgi:hypothetical protein
MKAFTTMLLLGLGLSAQQGFAQAPAVISAPIAESSSRKQIVHQGVSTTLLSRGKALAGDMQVVSGKIKGIVDQTQALHAQWYSSLLQISAGVRNYRRVREIYAAQASMISQFSSGVADLRGRGLSPNQVPGAAAGKRGPDWRAGYHYDYEPGGNDGPSTHQIHQQDWRQDAAAAIPDDLLHQ